MTRPTMPPRDLIGPDTPLRLDVAAAVAFPDGSMTANGLRWERDHGRLVVERVARKDYTTLSHIARMRELCRLKEKVPGSGSEKPGEAPTVTSPDLQPGSSETEPGKKALDAALAIAQGLSESSPDTSRASTSTKRRKGNVIRLPSRSRT